MDNRNQDIESSRALAVLLAVIVLYPECEDAIERMVGQNEDEYADLRNLVRHMKRVADEGRSGDTDEYAGMVRRVHSIISAAKRELAPIAPLLKTSQRRRRKPAGPA